METDLSRSDLRGRSFRMAKLPSANLAGSDLRGSDFTGADLHGADCSRVRCGMSRGWMLLVGVSALALSVAIGIASGWAGGVIHHLIASDDPRRRAMGLFIAVTVALLLIIGTWRGLRRATVTVLPVAAAIAVAVALVAIASGIGTGAGALAVIGFLLLALAIIALAVLARAMAGIISQPAFVVVAVGGGLVGGAIGGGLTAAAIAIGSMLMARRSSKADTLFPSISRLCATIACRRGSRFRDADLTGAIFDHAQLIACDFRGACLDRARLDRAAAHLCRFDS